MGGSSKGIKLLVIQFIPVEVRKLRNRILNRLNGERWVKIVRQSSNQCAYFRVPSSLPQPAVARTHGTRGFHEDRRSYPRSD